MQSHLSLVLIPPFFPFFFFSHCCGVEELGAAAVSADCSAESAEGDKLLDAITVVHTSTAVLTHSRSDGLKNVHISLFAHILDHTYLKDQGNLDWELLAKYHAGHVSSDYTDTRARSDFSFLKSDM